MQLGLGTAQFGLNYGLTNRRGRIAGEEAAKVLEVAAECGIGLLDTAPSYGEAEHIIGEALRSGLRFRVIIKTATFGPENPAEPNGGMLRETFLRSLGNLGLKRVDGLLLHHSSDALVPGGRALVDELQALKSEGLVERIGVSIYGAGDLEAILEMFTPDIVQLPLSVLDQRLVQSGHLARLHHMGVEIHARSVFLQGALLAAPADLPEFLAPLRDKLEALHSLMRATGFSLLEGALAFIAQHREVSAAIVGVTGRNELLQIAAAAMAANSIKLDFRSFAEQDDALLNPVRWTTAPEHATGVIQ